MTEQQGGTGLRDAENARREADAQLSSARALGPRMDSLRAQLVRLRETNHFRESFAAMMREQGHRG